MLVAYPKLTHVTQIVLHVGTLHYPKAIGLCSNQPCLVIDAVL